MYSPSQRYQPTGLSDNDLQIHKAVAFVQAANPNAIGNGLEETINGLKKE